MKHVGNRLHKSLVGDSMTRNLSLHRLLEANYMNKAELSQTPKDIHDVFKDDAGNGFRHGCEIAEYGKFPELRI